MWVGTVATAGGTEGRLNGGWASGLSWVLVSLGYLKTAGMLCPDPSSE